MADLHKIELRFSPLSKRVVLARFGKDRTVALDKRDAMNDFLQALCSYAFDGEMPPAGGKAEFRFGAGDEQFVCTLQRREEGHG